MLRTVAPVRTFEAVIAELRNAIVSGQFKPGDRLPSQRELAEHLGVSRNSVVQAIRMLSLAGLITVRPGATGGAFVQRLDGNGFVETLRLLLDLDQTSLEEVIELRAGIEGHNAAWAAERCTFPDLEKFREITSRVAELADEMDGEGGDPHAWPLLLTQDALFHRAVAEAAHNRASTAVMLGTMGVLNRQLSRLPPACAPEVVESLEEITDAISQRDELAARDSIVKHIHYFSWEVAERGRPLDRFPPGGHRRTGRQAMEPSSSDKRRHWRPRGGNTYPKNQDD